MFVIGIDPHRGSHAAAVLDGDEHVQAVLQLAADRQQRQRLLSWASEFTPRLWAVEGATGTGALLAQQLVAAGESVVDVPPKLAARVRLLDNDHSDKTDTHDARSTAIVALRNARLRQVSLEDHTRRAAAAGQAPPRSDRGPHAGDLSAAHHGVLPRRRPPAPTATGRTGRQDPGRHPPDHGDRRRTQGAGPGPARRGPPPRPGARRAPRPHPRTRSPARAPRSPSCTASDRSSPPT